MKAEGLKQKIKVKLKLKHCRPGMVIAETIYNDYGAVIVWEDTVLTENILLKLNELNIESILIYKGIDTEEAAEEKSKRFEENYQQNIQAFKKVLFDVSVGRNIKIEQVIEVTDRVCECVNENKGIIDSISQIREVDEYTYHHCLNVSMLSMLIGKWMGLDSENIKKLVLAGVLHDIGKAKISPAILNKPDKLTKIEFEEMKKHPEYGYMILKEQDIDEKILEAVLTHHEREDGSGYPLGLKSDSIRLFAKILAVADIFDAMTADRMYKKRVTPFEVFDLMQNSSFGVLDPKVLDIFLRNISHYYIGEKVLINDGEIAEIVYFDLRNISRPLLKVDNGYIDLIQRPEIKIVELL